MPDPIFTDDMIDAATRAHHIIAQGRRLGKRRLLTWIRRRLGLPLGSPPLVSPDWVAAATGWTLDADVEWPEHRALNALDIWRADAVVMAQWLAESLHEPVIPEVTDEVRERWRAQLETVPEQHSDTGPGMTIEELLGNIDLALKEYREERNE